MEAYQNSGDHEGLVGHGVHLTHVPVVLLLPGQAQPVHAVPGPNLHLEHVSDKSWAPQTSFHIASSDNVTTYLLYCITASVILYTIILKLFVL